MTFERCVSAWLIFFDFGRDEWMDEILTGEGYLYNLASRHLPSTLYRHILRDSQYPCMIDSVDCCEAALLGILPATMIASLAVVDHRE